jgi:hypothetical protein
MNDRSTTSSSTPAELRRGERIAGCAFGTLFVLLGVAVLATTGSGLAVGPAIAGGVLLALGIEAVWRTAQGRRSWLMRIGPLP